MKLSPKALGLACAVLTVLIWSSFIVVARASAAHTLLPLDIGFLRIIGAGCVLLPWGWWLMRAQRQTGERVGSFMGLSPLPWRITALGGFFGSMLYAMLAYSGFFFAPAAHASVLMPGSLPLWTALLAKEADPARDILLLEGSRIGWAATPSRPPARTSPTARR